MTERLDNARLFLEQLRKPLSTPSRKFMEMRARKYGLPFDEAALLRIIAEEEPKALATQQRKTTDEDRQRQIQDEQRFIRLEEQKQQAELQRQQQDDDHRRRERELQIQQKELELRLREAQLRRLESPPQGFGTASSYEDEDTLSPEDL
jgi:hypothetical protein